MRLFRLTALVILFALAVGVLIFFIVAERTGECASLTAVPSFGNDLPDVKGRFQYIVRPFWHSMVLRGEIQQKTFDEIADQLRLSRVKYEKGFEGKYFKWEPQYEAKGDRVWTAWGQLKGGGRTQVAIFYVPTSEQEGILYLYIR